MVDNQPVAVASATLRSTQQIVIVEPCRFTNAPHDLDVPQTVFSVHLSLPPPSVVIPVHPTPSICSCCQTEHQTVHRAGPGVGAGADPLGDPLNSDGCCDLPLPQVGRAAVVMIG